MTDDEVQEAWPEAGACAPVTQPQAEATASTAGAGASSAPCGGTPPVSERAVALAHVLAAADAVQSVLLHHVNEFPKTRAPEGLCRWS